MKYFNIVVLFLMVGCKSVIETGNTFVDVHNALETELDEFNVRTEAFQSNGEFDSIWLSVWENNKSYVHGDGTEMRDAFWLAFGRTAKESAVLPSKMMIQNLKQEFSRKSSLSSFRMVEAYTFYKNNILILVGFHSGHTYSDICRVLKVLNKAICSPDKELSPRIEDVKRCL